MSPSASKKKRRGSREFFYVKNGKRQDAAIHEAILAAGGNAGVEGTIKRAMADGMSAETARQLFGNGGK